MRGVDGKNTDEAKALRNQAEEKGWDLYVLELDVAEDSSVDKAVAEAVEKAGSIDVLVNYAGIGNFGIQETFTPEQVKNLFDVNVFGVLRLNRAVLPHMREAGSGKIIYLSSGLGRVLFPLVGPYAATKFAVEALAEAASYELEPLGIHTHIIQPGAYGTSFGENMMQPDNPGRMETYGATKKMFESFAEPFSNREGGDPQEVVTALVAAVEGETDLRQPVGDDMKQGVVTINLVC